MSIFGSKWSNFGQNTPKKSILRIFPQKKFASFFKRPKYMFLLWRKWGPFIAAFVRNRPKRAFLAKNGQFWPFLAKKGAILNFRQKPKSSLFKFSECTASCKKTETIIARFRRKLGYGRTDARTHGRTDGQGWILRSFPLTWGTKKYLFRTFCRRLPGFFKLGPFSPFFWCVKSHFHIQKSVSGQLWSYSPGTGNTGLIFLS